MEIPIDFEDQEIKDQGIEDQRIEDQKVEGQRKDSSLNEAEGTPADEQMVDVGPIETRPEPALSKNGIDYLDQLQRLKAEFDNYRKRMEKEKQDYYTYAKGRVIQNLLPVLDDLDRMAHHGKGPVDPMAAGIELIHQKMKAVLLKEGLEEINPVGKAFDPAFHEALGVVSVVTDQDGRVMEELERGYLLQGRLLRPSRVMVGKAKEDE